MGYDVCEYPDSNKVLLAPSFDIFDKNAQLNYFDGEMDITGKWSKLTGKKDQEN